MSEEGTRMSRGVARQGPVAPSAHSYNAPETGATAGTNHPGKPPHVSAGRGQSSCREAPQTTDNGLRTRDSHTEGLSLSANVAAKYIRHAARDARSCITRKQYGAALEAVADIEHMIGVIERELAQ